MDAVPALGQHTDAILTALGYAPDRIESLPQKYLDIEAALARVQARLLDIIPQEAADEIVSNCTIDKIDMDKLRQQTERIGYPVLGVVSSLTRCAATSWASFVTGAPRPRTSPIPRRCSRCARH